MPFALRILLTCLILLAGVPAAGAPAVLEGRKVHACGVFCTCGPACDCAGSLPAKPRESERIPPPQRTLEDVRFVSLAAETRPEIEPAGIDATRTPARALRALRTDGRSIRLRTGVFLT